jgi:hypothetical protein
VERFLLRQRVLGSTGDGGQEMKIYMLLMLIGVFVGISYVPLRAKAKPASPAPADSVPA